MAGLTAKQNFMETSLDSLARKLNQDLVKIEKMGGEREDLQPIVEKMVAGVIVKLHEKLVESFPKASISYQNTTMFTPEEDADGSKFIIVPMGGLKHLNHGHDAAFIAMGFIDKNDVMQDAIVYNPFTDQRFFASNGGGAFSAESRLRISNRKESCDYVIYSNKKLADEKLFNKVADLAIEQVKTNQALRLTDASLLDLMLVLGGKKDAFVGTGLTMHEALIAKLFAKEAGAIITGFKAEDVTDKTTSIIVANSKLHAAVLAKLK
jgi:myo-inositol-1(or 4)-monophosphatase